MMVFLPFFTRYGLAPFPMYYLISFDTTRMCWATYNFLASVGDSTSNLPLSVLVGDTEWVAILVVS